MTLHEPFSLQVLGLAKVEMLIVKALNMLLDVILDSLGILSQLIIAYLLQVDLAVYYHGQCFLVVL